MLHLPLWVCDVTVSVFAKMLRQRIALCREMGLTAQGFAQKMSYGGKGEGAWALVHTALVATVLASFCCHNDSAVGCLP